MNRRRASAGGQLTLAALLAFSTVLALGWTNAPAAPSHTVEVVVTPTPRPGQAVPQP